MLNFLCCFIHRVPYLEKWSSLIPLQIDWPLTIHQHLRSFIKLLMFFYALMLVMFILHLISIFRILLAPICSSCLEMEEYLFHCFFFTVLLSLSWLRVLCGFFFFFLLLLLLTFLEMDLLLLFYLLFLSNVFCLIVVIHVLIAYVQRCKLRLAPCQQSAQSDGNCVFLLSTLR